METSLQLLLFKVSDRRYAVPAEAVHAVTSRHAVGQVPCLELARLLGGRSARGGMAIVLRQGGEPVCALAVDQVLEVDSLPLTGLHALPFLLRQGAGGIFAVYLPPTEPEASIPVFDPAALVADAKRRRGKRAQ